MPLNLDHNFRHSEHLKELRTVGATSTIYFTKIEFGWTIQ